MKYRLVIHERLSRLNMTKHWKWESLTTNAPFISTRERRFKAFACTWRRHFDVLKHLFARRVKRLELRGCAQNDGLLGAPVVGISILVDRLIEERSRLSGA